MTIFLLSHLGFSVLLETLLELAGHDVFRDVKSVDEPNGVTPPLVDTSKHKTKLYSYVVLLDVCSKGLLNQLKQPDAYNKMISKSRNFVTSITQSTQEKEEVSDNV